MWLVYDSCMNWLSRAYCWTGSMASSATAELGALGHVTSCLCAPLKLPIFCADYKVSSFPLHIWPCLPSRLAVYATVLYADCLVHRIWHSYYVLLEWANWHAELRCQLARCHANECSDYADSRFGGSTCGASMACLRSMLAVWT